LLKSVVVRYALILLLLAGCSSKSPDEQLTKDVGPAMSWVATLQFASQKWLVNSVPTLFVRAAAGNAKKAFDKARKSVEQSRADDRLRDRIRRRLDEGSRLADALEKGDRRLVAEALRR
jgi:hypothetical protein